MVNSLFTNGMIAVKERSLLGEKLLRFTEMDAEDVLRALRESGFGGVQREEGEMLLEEERDLDAFIREYAPTARERAYLLAPRDFHNGKALVKAAKLGISAENMLAPPGEIEVARLEEAVAAGSFGALGALGETMERALAEEKTGAELGAMFDRALFAHLKRVCRGSLVLKRLLRDKADGTDLITAARAENGEQAKGLFVGGGALKEAILLALADGGEKAAEALKKTKWGAFYALIEGAKERGVPYTEAERALGSFEAEYFAAHKYELEGKEPFLYYVFRRRAEIADVRMILVCLRAGLKEQDIKKRLRSV